MDTQLVTFVAIGFVAQVIDGALGMAFGVISTTTLLTLGVSPAQASAIVHTAEVFTTGASAISHVVHRNIRWRLMVELAVAGGAGAIAGAWLLSNIDGRVVRPFVAAYLLALGLVILCRALRGPPARDAKPAYAVPLGLVGGFLDAIGGGGWGGTVTTTLIGSGHAPRLVIGSVNAAELFVTVAAATTFFVELGMVPLIEVIGLTIGGVIAAPFGAVLASRVPARPLMLIVAALVIVLSGWQIARSTGLV